MVPLYASIISLFLYIVLLCMHFLSKKHYYPECIYIINDLSIIAIHIFPWSDYVFHLIIVMALGIKNLLIISLS